MNSTYGFKKETDLTLDDVITVLANIPNINYGGCGIAAYTIYQFLKNNDEDIKIAFLSHDSYSSLNNLKYDYGEVDKVYPVNHICLYYKKNFFDCKDIVDISKYRYIEFVTEEKLIKALNSDGWNYVFDRSKAFKIIKDKLEINLEDIRII